MFISAIISKTFEFVHQLYFSWVKIITHRVVIEGNAEGALRGGGIQETELVGAKAETWMGT